MVRNTLTMVAVATTFTFTAISAEAQNRRGLAAIIAGALIYCGATQNCGSNNQAKAGQRKAGPRDAVALTREQKMMVQEGLNAYGYNTNGIDGVFGQGTRRAVRSYQADRGMSVTGVLTAQQISDLIGNSPAYVGLAPSDDRRFAIEFGRDVSAEGLAEIQRLLNLEGFDAGPVDGKLGRRTINAIAAYKRARGLAGPGVPTVRLLAKLEGRAFDAPDTPKSPDAPAEERLADGYQGECTVECESVEGESVVAPEVIEDAPTVLSLDLLNARTGMTEEDVILSVSDNMEGEPEVFQASAADIGGNDVLSYGVQIVEPAWPDAGSTTVSAYFDEIFPEVGAFAIVRTVSFGEDIGIETVEAAVLPQFIEQYGAEGLVADSLTWVSDPKILTAVRSDPSTLATCGKIGHMAWEIGPLSTDNWYVGGGPKLDLAGFGDLSQGCGDVMAISYTGSSITVSLWNSDMLLAHKARLGGVPADEDAAPKIKIKF